MSLEEYFCQFRKNTVGIDQEFSTPYGRKKILYADWIASGRLYGPIEDTLSNKIGAFVGNTHTETTVTGTSMTLAYCQARQIIKRHVNASPKDVILPCGSGMTSAVNKLQRILGFRIHENFKNRLNIPANERPVVFITHMEHHSNQTSWLETIADVEYIQASTDGLVDAGSLPRLLEKHAERKIKIAALTACSNVTGIKTPYHEIAEIMHKNGGYCFVDFACSAPYVTMNMHPENPLQSLDAVYFSPHKFLGGPGSSGILVFAAELYRLSVPDRVGGGTVLWTNPWKNHCYVADIETREDGGTPAFLQTIKAALAILLKEKMGTKNLIAREGELVSLALDELKKINRIHILADNVTDRLGAIAFYLEGMHYNLLVKMLNDRFGIQLRGGCACAGTYGHYLFYIPKHVSHKITERIDKGDLSLKPGWARLSLHPIMSDAEVLYIVGALKRIEANAETWSRDYLYDKHTNEYRHRAENSETVTTVNSWFTV